MSLTDLIRKRIAWLVFPLVIVGIGTDTAYSQTTQSADVRDLSFWEELAFWESVKDSKNPAEYEAYLDAYPEGRFASLARVRIESLAEQPPPEPVGESTESGLPDAAVTTPPLADGLAPGELFRDCDECPQMVVIPPGRFEMGADPRRREEQPAHTVTIAQAFAMSVHEITVSEWDVCLREGGCRYSPTATGDQGQFPISNVSWHDAQEYVRWLSDRTGDSYRLPSEAEWEHAARGATSTAYWWGDELEPNQANCSDCASAWDGKQPAPVGSFSANPFKLHDVHGNVWEWTMDCWNDSYDDAPADGSPWTQGDCLSRVMRGGAWKLGHDYMRASRRHRYDRDVRYYLHGFRVVKTL